MPWVMRCELQQAMMTSFLLANANNYSRLLHDEPAAAAPWQVSHAEQFIEANWDQPMTIEALVAATGVSARSLFACSKQHGDIRRWISSNACDLGKPGANC